MKSILILTQESIILNKGLLNIFSGYFSSFTNVQLTAQWFQVGNLFNKLDQYPRCDDRICMSWHCVCDITMKNLIPCHSLFYLGNQSFHVVK